MKRKVSSLLAALLAMLMLAGCAGPAEPVTQPDSPASGATDTPAAPDTGNDPSSPASDLPDTIRIGVSSAMSGPMAMDGVFTKRGLEVLMAEVEAAGGVDVGGVRLPVEFIFEDDEGKPETAVNVFRKLIEQDNVVAIVGPPMSGCMLAGGPIAQEAGIPAIGTMTTNPMTTQIGDFIFRACFIDAFQAEVAAKYLVNELGAMNVAIISNNANDYSTGLAEEFERQFTALAGTIVEHQTYAGADVRDFNVQLARVNAANPDAIFLPVYYGEVPLIIGQARQIGIDTRILGTDSWDTPEILLLAGAQSLEGVEYITAFTPLNQDPVVQNFTNTFREMFGEEPNSNGVFAYNAGKIVLEAITRAGSLGGRAIRDEMEALYNFTVATGSVSFDETRNPRKDAHIVRFEADGSTSFVTTIYAN